MRRRIDLNLAKLTGPAARQLLAVGLALTGGVLAAREWWRALAQVPLLPAAGHDASSLKLARYAPLAHLLPQRGVVGYWCDGMDQPGGVLGLRQNDELGDRLLHAQLALVPVRLVVGTQHRWVIADFAGEVPEAPHGSGLMLRHRIGAGLALFENPSLRTRR